MLNRTTLVQALALATVTATASCALPTRGSINLDGTSWQLLAVTPAKSEQAMLLASKPGVAYRIHFEGNRLRLEHGCNQAQGTYSHNGNAIVAHEMVSTLMACANDRLMRADELMMSMLRRSESKPAVVRGGLMTFNVDGVEVVFARQGPRL